MYLKTTLLALISTLFIGCGGSSDSSTATTVDTVTPPITVNNLSFSTYGATTLQDCNYVYFDTIELTGTDSTFELSNCDIGELIFHADNSIIRIINTGAITFDHNGTGNTIEALQADLDTIDDPTLQEVAIIY